VPSGQQGTKIGERTSNMDHDRMASGRQPYAIMASFEYCEAKLILDPRDAAAQGGRLNAERLRSPTECPDFRGH
jgi:hypothetical protein